MFSILYKDVDLTDKKEHWVVGYATDISILDSGFVEVKYPTGKEIILPSYMIGKIEKVSE